MPRAASTCCAALVLGAVQARGPNCVPAAQARPDAAWPREDSRRPYAALAHCQITKEVAPRLEAWLDAMMERRCPQSYFRQLQPASTPRCAYAANTTCRDGRPVEATLRSLRDVAGPCADDVRDQLTEEYLGWWGFCDWDTYVIPPLSGVAAPGPNYDVAYFIVAYRDAAFLERQFRALYDARNLYVYHVDVRVGKDVVDRLRALKRAHDNVRVARCGTVIYLTDSASWLVYRFMAWLVAHDVKFGHAVPLDGGAYPLVGPKRMRALLPADDGTAWVGAWACAKGKGGLVAVRKTNGFVTLATCAGNAALHTSDVRVCFKQAVGTNLSDPAAGAGCGPGLYAPPPGADVERGHRRTVEDIAQHWRKAFTGNSAIYSERTVRALVASPSVKRLHAFFKYGYLAIEEHFWAIVLDPVWKSTSVSGAPTIQH